MKLWQWLPGIPMRSYTLKQCPLTTLLKTTIKQMWPKSPLFLTAVRTWCGCPDTSEEFLSAGNSTVLTISNLKAHLWSSISDYQKKLSSIWLRNLYFHWLERNLIVENCIIHLSFSIEHYSPS